MEANMGRKLAASLICASLLGLGLVGSLAAQEANKGRREIILPLKEAKAVHVDHFEHQEKAAPCESCHGLFPQEEGVVARLKGSGKLERGQVMRQCRGCHQERKTGANECGGCHRG
jgi:hypothetical protein